MYMGFFCVDPCTHPVCAYVGTGVDKRCMSQCTCLCRLVCADLRPQRGMGPPGEATVWGSGGGESWLPPVCWGRLGGSEREGGAGGRAGAGTPLRSPPPRQRRRERQARWAHSLSAKPRKQQRRRPSLRSQIYAGTDTANAAAAGLSPQRERRWDIGGLPSPAAPASPPWRRPGRMLQMVKTLAQFTIALEDMRDLGAATASGETAGSSGADAEEPGEAQVHGREETARDLGQNLELSGPGPEGDLGSTESAGLGTHIRHTSCVASGLGAQKLVMGAGRLKV